jgi:hypothetical protein
MPTQEPQPETLCRICGSRPATTTYPFWSAEVPACDSCTPFDLTLALAADLMRQRRPPSYPQALYLATLATVVTLSPPPRPPGRESEPYTLDDLFPGRAELEISEAGQAAGLAWAGRSATPKELARLARLDDPRGWRPGRLDTFGRDRAAEGVAEAFHAFERPDEAGRPGAAEEFWRAVLSEADWGKEASGQFTYAFAEAAQCVALMQHEAPGR